ncbi:Hypothetical predicted protein [Cloeon dipterum]|uniref:Uncharacterized protein n=1 Tax=Cloeon dipterum TaxID=197152 RepID=A0A8S1CFM7_9INSE|nr:Hypothetical predicted protein [Cloeon dipterum]
MKFPILLSFVLIAVAVAFVALANADPVNNIQPNCSSRCSCHNTYGIVLAQSVVGTQRRNFTSLCYLDCHNCKYPGSQFRRIR